VEAVLTRTFKTLLNFRLSTKYRTCRKSDPSRRKWYVCGQPEGFLWVPRCEGAECGRATGEHRAKGRSACDGAVGRGSWCAGL